MSADSNADINRRTSGFQPETRNPTEPETTTKTPLFHTNKAQLHEELNSICKKMRSVDLRQKLAYPKSRKKLRKTKKSFPDLIEGEEVLKEDTKRYKVKREYVMTDKTFRHLYHVYTVGCQYNWKFAFANCMFNIERDVLWAPKRDRLALAAMRESPWLEKVRTKLGTDGLSPLSWQGGYGSIGEFSDDIGSMWNNLRSMLETGAECTKDYKAAKEWFVWLFSARHFIALKRMHDFIAALDTDKFILKVSMAWELWMDPFWKDLRTKMDLGAVLPELQRHLLVPQGSGGFEEKVDLPGITGTLLAKRASKLFASFLATSMFQDHGFGKAFVDTVMDGVSITKDISFFILSLKFIKTCVERLRDFQTTGTLESLFGKPELETKLLMMDEYISKLQSSTRNRLSEDNFEAFGEIQEYLLKMSMETDVDIKTNPLFKSKLNSFIAALNDYTRCEPLTKPVKTLGLIVTGEPGLGKSTMLPQLERILRALHGVNETTDVTLRFQPADNFVRSIPHARMVYAEDAFTIKEVPGTSMLEVLQRFVEPNGTIFEGASIAQKACDKYRLEIALVTSNALVYTLSSAGSGYDKLDRRYLAVHRVMSDECKAFCKEMGIAESLYLQEWFFDEKKNTGAVYRDGTKDFWTFVGRMDNTKSIGTISLLPVRGVNPGEGILRFDNDIDLMAYFANIVRKNQEEANKPPKAVVYCEHGIPTREGVCACSAVKAAQVSNEALAKLLGEKEPPPPPPKSQIQALRAVNKSLKAKLYDTLVQQGSYIPCKRKKAVYDYTTEFFNSLYDKVPSKKQIIDKLPSSGLFNRRLMAKSIVAMCLGGILIISYTLLSNLIFGLMALIAIAGSVFQANIGPNVVGVPEEPDKPVFAYRKADIPPWVVSPDDESNVLKFEAYGKDCSILCVLPRMFLAPRHMLQGAEDQIFFIRGRKVFVEKRYIDYEWKGDCVSFVTKISKEPDGCFDCLVDDLSPLNSQMQVVWKGKTGRAQYLEDNEYVVDGAVGLAGDCGKPYFAAGNHLIVGFHVRGAPDPFVRQATAFYSLTKKMVLASVERFGNRGIAVNLQAPSVAPELVKLVEQSKKDLVKPGDVAEVSARMSEDELIDSDTRLLGKIDKTNCKMTGKETELFPLFQHLLTEKMRPPHTGHALASAKWRSPYTVAMTCVKGTLNKEVFEAMDHIVDAYVQLGVPKNLGPITLKQALVGSDDCALIRATRSDTSVGYLHKLRGETKKALFGKKGETTFVHPSVISRTQEILRNAYEGKSTVLVELANLKDEMIKISKVVEQGKGRLFFSVEKELNLVMKMLGANVHAVTGAFGLDLGIPFTMNPGSSDWDDLAKRLLGVGHDMFDGDFVSYDVRHGILLDILGELIYSIAVCLGYSKKDALALSSLLQTAMRKLVVLEGFIFWRGSKLSSGQFFTLFMNSLINWLVTLSWVLYTAKRNQVVVVVSKDYYSCRCGDDFVLVLSKRLSGMDCFHPRNLVEYASTLGYLITSADKSPDVRWKTLEEVQFLKRGFRLCVDGTYKAPLEVQSIARMLCYVVGNPKDERKRNADVCVVASREASLHAEEFNTMLIDIFTRNNLPHETRERCEMLYKKRELTVWDADTEFLDVEKSKEAYCELVHQGRDSEDEEEKSSLPGLVEYEEDYVPTPVGRKSQGVRGWWFAGVVGFTSALKEHVEKTMLLPVVTRLTLAVDRVERRLDSILDEAYTPQKERTRADLARRKELAKTSMVWGAIHFVEDALSECYGKQGPLVFTVVMAYTVIEVSLVLIAPGVTNVVLGPFMEGYLKREVRGFCFGKSVSELYLGYVLTGNFTLVVTVFSGKAALRIATLECCHNRLEDCLVSYQFAMWGQLLHVITCIYFPSIAYLTEAYALSASLNEALTVSQRAKLNGKINSVKACLGKLPSILLRRDFKEPGGFPEVD